MKRSIRRKAFSLLELLAVVVIIGIIAAIVVKRVFVSMPLVKEDACLRNKAEINRVIERHFFEQGDWATDISQIAASPDFPDGVPNCPVTGNPYTIDAVTHRISGHTPGNH